jgi:hypothetical protein
MITTHTTPLEYEDRVVTFIDVLGFAELVKASDVDVIARAKVSKLILTDELFAKFSERFFRGDATFFSDSFVLSVQAEGIIFLIREAGQLCRRLLLLGFPCRGAVTAGALYHRDRLVVGPALVKAYQLEQSVAIYPRVILDEAAMERWREEFRPGSAHPHLGSLVKQDRDGQYFINIFDPGWSEFLHWTDFIQSTDLIPTDPTDFLNTASAQVKKGLASFGANAKVHAKYSWLDAQCADHATGGR